MSTSTQSTRATEDEMQRYYYLDKVSRSELWRICFNVCKERGKECPFDRKTATKGSMVAYLAFRRYETS